MHNNSKRLTLQEHMFAHELNCVLISTLSRMYSCMPYHQNSLQRLAIQAYSSLHSTKVPSRSATQPGWCQPEATRLFYYSEKINICVKLTLSGYMMHRYKSMTLFQCVIVVESNKRRGDLAPSSGMFMKLRLFGYLGS
jgi:hypothetical protein